jgi:replicative DNA helicase
MDALLTDDEIAARIQGLTAYPHSVVTHPQYRYVRPLHETAETLIDYSSNPDGRFMLGIAEIDAMIRGFSKGELAYITGRPHSGKTQVFLNAINNNRTKNIALFTPDEPAELVLAKLVSLRTGEPNDELEERLRKGDKDAQRLVRNVAREDFANVLVFDESLSLGAMKAAVDEAEQYLQAELDAVAVDFLELILTEDNENVVSKSQSVKRWGKDINRPVLCMHQAKRGDGNRGREVGMDDMRFGGDMEAIYVLGVWRKRDDTSLEDFERLNHADTVTISVSKNKRPPSKKGAHDYYLDPRTGRIAPISELPTVMSRMREQASKGWVDQEML